MADLFEGYRRVRHGTRCSRPPGTPREAFEPLHEALARCSSDELRARADTLALGYLDAGRHVRLRGRGAAVPARHRAARGHRGRSGRTSRAGVAQRVRALEAFLADIYGPQRALADGVIPGGWSSARRATSCGRPPASSPPNGVRMHVVRHRPRSADEHGGLAGARGQRARAVGRELRACRTDGRWRRRFPSCSRPMRIRPVERLPAPAAAGAARGRARRRRRPDRRRAHARRLQLAPTSSTRCSPALMGVELVEGRDLFCARRARLDAHDRGPSAAST